MEEINSSTHSNTRRLLYNVLQVKVKFTLEHTIKAQVGL